MSFRTSCPDASAGAKATPAGAVALALFALIFVLAAAVGWWLVDPVKYEVLAASRAGLPVGDAAIAAVLARAPAVALAGAALAAAALFLVVQEIRRRALSQAIESAGAPATGLLLLCLLLWFGHAYLYPGWMLGGDAGAHVARIVQLGLALRDGEWPVWSTRFYLGAPFLQFTGPLFFQIGGVLAALIGDGMLATKILLFALHFMGGAGAYVLLRRLGAARLAALAGAVAYAGAWAHLHLFVYNGVLPQALTLALLPVAFAAAESCLRRQEPGLLRRFGWDGTLLALGAAGLLATHQPHGLLAGLYLGAFCLWRWWRSGRRPAALGRVILAGALGILAASAAIVPYLVERDTVMAAGTAGVFSLQLPTLGELGKLMLWRNTLTSTGADSAAYLGITAVVLALVGIVAGLRDAARGRTVIAGAPYFAVALAVSLVVGGAFIRDVQFTLFFLAPLVARGVMALAAPGAARAGTIALGALAALLLDLGPTALQPLNRADKGYYAEGLAYLEAHPAGRVVLVGGGGWSQDAAPAAGRRFLVAAGPSASPLAWGSVGFVSGPHNQTATPAHNPAIAVLMRLERELNAGAVSRQTHDLLALLNVGRVIFDNGAGFGFSDGVPGTVADGPLGRIIAVSGATPALYAPALAAVDIAPADRPLLWPSMDDTGLARQAEAMALADLAATAPDFTRRAAARIAVPGRAPVDGAATAAADSRLVVRAFAEGRQAVRLAVETPGPGYLRLAYAAHPWLRVTVNGQAAAPVRTLTGLLAIPVPAGPVEVAIAAEASGLRGGFGLLSLAAVLAIVALPLAGRRRAGA